MKLVVKNSTGDKLILDIAPDVTFADLKRRVEAESGLRLDLRDVTANRRVIDANRRVIEYFMNDEPAEEEEVQCSVPGCLSKKSTHPNKAFFEFPEEEIRAHQWVLYCRRIGKESKGVLGGKGSTVCSDHFKRDQFVKNTTTLLKRTAVPCINPTLPPTVLPHRLKPPRAPLHCRLCASTSSASTTFIYSKTGESMRLAEKINACLPIKVSQDDMLPKQVCGDCISALNAHFVLFDLAVTSEQNLKKISDRCDCSAECPLCLEGDLRQMSNPPESPRAEIPSLSSPLPDTMWMECDDMPQSKEAEEFEEEDDEESEIDEISNIGEEGIYSCRVCGVEDSDFTSAQQHALSHSAESNVFACTICDNYYATAQELTSHFAVHCPTVPTADDLIATCYRDVFLLRCPYCSESFQSESKLEVHMKCHRSMNNNSSSESELSSVKTPSKSAPTSSNVQNPFGCDICPKTFLKRSHLRNHKLSTHKVSSEISVYTCKVCSEAFPTTKNAVAHMDAAHPAVTAAPSSYSFDMTSVSRIFICEFCEKTFVEPSVLNSHRETEHSAPESPFTCKMCAIEFTTYGEMKDHREHGHAATEGPEEYSTDHGVPSAFLCEYCDRNFFDYVKYTEHLTIHYGTEPYHCRICMSKFKTYSEVTDHRLVSHGVTYDDAFEDGNDTARPFDCHYCEKSFAIEDALIKHIRMHTGEKPFACDVCGKGFSQSSGLNTHKKVHSDLRPYTCYICPRTFKIKGDRDVHIRKHSGQRPFVCEFCFKAFMTQHVYSQHRKIHTGERPYRCDVCHVAFRRSHVLTVHKRIHTGEKPNVCDFCGKRYRQKGDMLKHRRTQHGVTKVPSNATTATVPTTASEPIF